MHVQSALGGWNGVILALPDICFVSRLSLLFVRTVAVLGLLSKVFFGCSHFQYHLVCPRLLERCIVVDVVIL